jgi:hypothetical protein
VTYNDPDDDDVLLWGGNAIAAAIGPTRSQLFPMLNAGRIKSAVKRGGRWSAWRKQLRREFGLVDMRQRDANGAEASPNAS